MVFTPRGLCVATLRELAPAIADVCTHAPTPCIDGEALSALSLALSLTLCPLPLALQRACLSTVTPWPQQGRLAAPSSYRYHRPGYGQTLQLTAGAACARPNPPSVAALFPPSPEPVAWSRCCSWFGHFRLPPSKLRPPWVRTGPTPYCPSATRRHRRIPLRLLCFAPVRDFVHQLEQIQGSNCKP